METIIKYDEELNNDETGDYEFKFFCEECVIVTYGFAQDANTALSYARERIEHLLKVARPDFVEIEMKGKFV